MAKDKVSTLDIKSLPRWQKYTIIAFVLVLAATFLISGAMIALVEFWAEGEDPNGFIGEEEVGAQFFRDRYRIIGEVLIAPDRIELVYPEVAFFDPQHQVARPDPDHPWFSQSVRIPDAMRAQILSEERAPRDPDGLRRELFGRLTWMHILLLREAREAGVTVPMNEAKLVAHEIVLGPLEDEEPIALEPDEEDEEPVLDLPSFEEREARFRAQVRREFDPSLYYEIVRELLTVRRYVENEISGNVSVSLDEVLDSFRAGQQLVESEFIRVPVFNERTTASVAFEGALPATLPGSLARNFEHDEAEATLTFEGAIDRHLRQRLLSVSDDAEWQRAVEELGDALSPFHPVVERRARQHLEEERAQARMRRELAATTGVSNEALFPDPVEAHAQERLNQDEGSEFRETRYQLAILPIRFEEMAQQTPIDPDLIERFYAHQPYRELYFRTELSDAEIDERLEALQGGVESLSQDLLDGFDRLAEATTPGFRGIEDAEARERDIDELSADFAGPLRESLRYRPFEEVRDEIREQLRHDAGEHRARLLVQRMQQEIQSHQRLNEDAYRHGYAVADATLQQARLYEELYWGARAEGGSVGLVPGVQEVERTVREALRAFQREAGLYDDPRGDAAGVPLDGLIEMSDYRAALARMRDVVSERGWEEFVRSTRISRDLDSIHDNDPGRLERQLEVSEARVAQLREARELEEEREREIQEVHRRWIERRLNEIDAFRDAYEEAFAALTERLERELEMVYLLEVPEAPRILLEERAQALAGELEEILATASQESDVEQRAFEAQQRAQAARADYETIRRGEREATDVPVEGTVDVLRALPPHAFGIEPVIVRNEMSYPGVFYQGLPGASVPPMRVQWGLTLEEILHSEQVREALPYFRDAREWRDGDSDTAGESLSVVLQNLQPRTYSVPLAVTGEGYYVIALLERTDPPMPSVADIEERALEHLLDQDSPRDRRVEAAREIADEIRKKLERRVEEVQRLSGEALAGQLERASERLAGTVGRTPYWPGDVPYERAALEELIALLRGEDVEVTTQTQVASGRASVQRRRAAHEARALLVRDAMNRVAQRHDFTVEQTRPFDKEDRLTRMWLTRGTEEFWRALTTLAPQFEFAPPLEEEFPARGEREEDALKSRRTAFVIARSLGTTKPDLEDVIELADLDLSAAEDARQRMRVQRILEVPELRRFTDLSEMIRHYETVFDQPVKILSRQPRGGGARR